MIARFLALNILVTLLTLPDSCHLFAQVRLPQLVRDSMVVQRDTKLKIWGWARAGENVKVTFNKKSYNAKAGADGKWFVLLPPVKAGGPYTMDISTSSASRKTGDTEGVSISASNKITLNNILAGDVWLCAGQSNMVHYLDLHRERYDAEIANVNYPEIRNFTIPTLANLEGRTDDFPRGNWKTANPKDIGKFAVVAYFFAKKLYEQYHVPIGLINASVGGTPIEAWTSEEGLKEFPTLTSVIQQNKDTAWINRTNRIAAQSPRRKSQDKGLNESLRWYDTKYVPKGWHTINIPGYWEDQGIKDLDGVVWYRREIVVPASMTGVPAKVALGRIVDADQLYINGTVVGNTSYQYPQRRYQVPQGLLKAGKNTLVVRVTNNAGKGGFIPDKPYYLAAGGDTIDLKGTWYYKVGEAFSPQRGSPGAISAQSQPTALFNGMVAPLTDYPVKGVLWYQGEANSRNAEEYEKLLPALIADWRNQWKQPALPFLYVQLPNYMDVNYLPAESQWARLRESQLKTLKVPNTAMAVAIDLGEWNDIHPGNKKPVGERLALAARKVAYHEKDLVHSGPLYESCRVDGNKMILTFSDIGSGLTSSDGEALRWFSVAGDDKKFVSAKAVIENNTIVVSGDPVAEPRFVRYAWADNPVDVNLYNKEGLPASSFEASSIDESKLWHGKKAAVVLTYDDALDVHLDNAIPVMDSLGIKGTFYLTAAAPACKNRIDEWKRVARNGHELGNHTLYHPCDASKPGRSWVTPPNDLSKYSTVEIARETEMTNAFLESLDGKKERTFAYTCGDTETGEGSFISAIKGQFVSMRGVRSQLNKLNELDLTNINCYGVDNSNAGQLISWAEKAREENALLVILFHGVGGGHNINVDLKKHNDFLKYLKSHGDDYWVTTMIDASKHCIEQTQKQK